MTPEPMLLALVDCNNFYVSCERVFRPDLQAKAVAVLSNNDGCIVARSQEVKDLGIKMGTPVHQVQHLIKRHNIHLFSSNYALYADMSQRVMQCLEAFTPQVEVYSIDESFLNLSGICADDPVAYGRIIKRSVQRATGIPVCVGIGPTKTLAKLANYAAKKWRQTGGVLDLSDPLRRERLMRLTPVEEVWGIGRQTSQRLRTMGIETIHDLARQPPETIQAQFNIVIARTVLELNGIACLALEDIIPDRQQIVCSRSFKRRLSDYDELTAALTCFCSRATEKLRHQHSVAGSITVFIRTNPFKPDEPHYQRSIHTRLKHASQDTRQIIGAAKQLLQEIYRPGYRYQKCGVQLGHIESAASPQQRDLFTLQQNQDEAKSQRLMTTLDQINQRFYRGVDVGVTALQRGWQCPVQYLSQRYTSRWDEIAIAKCR